MVGWLNKANGRSLVAALPLRDRSQRARWVSTPGRIARRLPIIRGVAIRLDETRAERDRLRQSLRKRDRYVERLRAERNELRQERDRLADLSGGPSFYALYSSMNRQRAWLKRDYGVRHPIWEVEPKLAGRSLAANLSVRVPRLLAGPAPPERLQEPVAERFIVKPIEGWSGRGVHALVREGERLFSLLDERTTSWEEVRGKLAADQKALAADAEAKGWRVSREFIVEELLFSGNPERPLPFDWKCYCIGGRVELIMQREAHNPGREGKRFKFWSPELSELGPVRHQDRYEASLPAPQHPRDLVASAERIARALPGPFVRVDLYDVPGGVAFGEITPRPGGDQRFTPDVDRRLGEAWERTLAAYLVGGPTATGQRHVAP